MHDACGYAGTLRQGIVTAVPLPRKRGRDKSKTCRARKLKNPLGAEPKGFLVGLEITPRE